MQRENAELSLAEVLGAYERPEPQTLRALWRQACNGLQRKLVVLDDDPTGVQTVHGVSVYTDWQPESILEGFREDSPLFFILTNSRAMSEEETVRVHRELGRRIVAASQLSGKDYLLLSRSDSTLRGHFPLETATLRRTIENCSSKRFGGEIVMPFFKEGGRFTLGNIHYVQEGERLIPAARTEFAADKSFGFRHSDLCAWCQEKTGGAFSAEEMCCIPLERLRAMDVDGIAAQLMQIGGFQKVIINALDDCDAQVFAAACAKAIGAGKEFLFRCAASLVKVLGGIEARPLLRGGELLQGTDGGGGLVVVGSHVNKTTRQLEYLRRRLPGLRYIEFDQHRVRLPGGLEEETERAAREASHHIRNGETVVLYTRRQRIDLPGGGADAQLELATRISRAVTETAARLSAVPAFVVAKGGITSSEIGVRALRVRRARVMGQLAPGVPVWMTDPDSAFPGMPYVIFPGNVGDEKTLWQVVDALLPKR